MFLEITDVILLALFIEAIVNALKPIWTKGEPQLTVSEYVSMGMGILLAVTCRINMLAYVVDVAYPVWVEYIFYVLTGIAIGRGTNFLYDLWSKLKEWKSGDFREESKEFEYSVDSDDLTDNQLRAILLQVGAPMSAVEACETREQLEKLLDSYAVEATDPPARGGAE